MYIYIYIYIYIGSSTSKAAAQRPDGASTTNSHTQVIQAIPITLMLILIILIITTIIMIIIISQPPRRGLMARTTPPRSPIVIICLGVAVYVIRCLFALCSCLCISLFDCHHLLLFDSEFFFLV